VPHRYNQKLSFKPHHNIEDAMSDIHEDAHTGPIKNPKQLLVAVIFRLLSRCF